MKSFFKKIFKKPGVQAVLAWLAAHYITFVFKTTRWSRVGWSIPEAYLKQGKGFITCFWHNRLLMGCFGWPSTERHFHMLISSHPDGQLIARIVAHHGIKTIAGSKNHGGGRALRLMIKNLKEGHTVGITPDGPRGPCYSVSQGVLTVAKLAKVDILPFTYSTNHCIILKSWDHFRLALPFGKGFLMWGEPFSLNEADSIENQRNTLRLRMLEISQKADEAVGIKQAMPSKIKN